MSGKQKILLLIAALFCAPAQEAFSGIPMSGGDNSIRRNLVSGGGALSSGTGFSLNCALAETAITTAAGSGFKFSSGLMPMAAQPGTIISITAVSKTTGTLELAWTAPGLDGFLGAASGGLYRIDTSSAPSHIFDPAVFVTEFSTSVTPGDPQVYVLHGLEPNTTYYTRIYLADARKVVAEYSAPSDESSLAALPVLPAVSGVYVSSVAFTWNIPPGDAEGYRLNASSTNFGALFAGGVVYSSSTDKGLQLTLTVTGLRPDTMHYFRLASLNWQGDVNFGAIIATRTLMGFFSLPIENLAVLPEALSRRVLFSWTNPASPDPLGVLVQVSTQPITETVKDGIDYQTGDVIADGSVVLSSAAGTGQMHAGLLLDSTYYYRFSSRSTAHIYSVFVSTECLLDLPPMSPAGLQASLNTSRTEITVTWNDVRSNYDGSSFRFTAEPLELARYEIYRATGIINTGWTLITSVPVSSRSVTMPVPDPDSVYYYKVAAVDSVGIPGTSMVVDTDRNLYAVAPDKVSRLKIPYEMAFLLTPGGNSTSSPLFVAALDRAQDEGGKVVKSLDFSLIQAPTGVGLDKLALENMKMDIVLHYQTENGKVVPSSFKNASAAAVAALTPSVRAADASSELGAYWFNGREYVKVFGTVDPAVQTVTVHSAFPGRYQIRTLARSSGVSFGVKEISNKVITPNGDGLNDYVVFTLDNPQDSDISGKIYDLSGAFVADMRPGTQIADTLTWDGKSGGAVVPRGVYVYQIKTEGKTFNGTIVVIR
ncbi:MAG: gliding motility-associated C-terminal domain-containing protein [Elusimicrobia bacterium]|nr:gliding motility-associated C-terminal domain-containing protein [Elusimicrobiota bacterium]